MFAASSASEVRERARHTCARLVPSLLLSVLLWPAGVRAQERAWSLGGAFTVQRISDLNGWGRGPEITLRRVAGSGWGIEFTPAVMFASDGFYDFRGASGTLGVARRVEKPRFWFTLSAGPAGMAGSDSDGTFLARGGGFAAGEVIAWASNGLGVYVRGAGRLWHDGWFGASASAGLALRW